MVAQNILTNIRPASGTCNDGTKGTKQDIEQWVIDFGTLPTVLNDAEVCFDTVDDHAGTPEKESMRSQTDLWVNQTPKLVKKHS